MYKPSTALNLSGHDLRKTRLLKRYLFPGTCAEKKIKRAARAYALAWAILEMLLGILFEVVLR
jgi:hypothetical protein